MKKSLFAVLLLSVIVFTACKDSDGTADTTPQSVESEADYTVIFWGMPGGNECAAFTDMLEMQQMREDGRIGDNVNFYGLLKTSSRSHAQDSLKKYGYDGTLLIDLGKKTGHKLVDSLDVDVNADTLENYLGPVDVLKEFNAQQYGDTLYPLNNADSLANFIKKAVAKYPAKKYILLLYGHGSGFDPTEETPYRSAYATRGCVYDDLNNQRFLSADSLVDAVNKSGTDISMIFFQCCLMSTLENMAAYQHCTDYILASDEVTFGGYMQYFMANISQGGPSAEALVSASKKTVDSYVNKYRDEHIYSSHGLYDLTKASSLLSIVKDITSWYTQAYDKDSAYINNIVAHTTLCCDLEARVDSSYVTKRNQVQNILAKRARNEEVSLEDLSKFVVNLKDILGVSVSTGFVFSDFLHKTLECQNQSTGSDMDFSKLQTLYNLYMLQLKDMAYIRATHEDSSVRDYCYLLTSPSVNIFTLNKENFHPTNAWKYYADGLNGTSSTHQLEAKLDLYLDAILNKDTQREQALYDELFSGTHFARYCTFEQVEANYTSSQFDQLTGWSNFLRKLTHNPNYLTNPGRVDYGKE